VNKKVLPVWKLAYSFSVYIIFPKKKKKREQHRVLSTSTCDVCMESEEIPHFSMESEDILYVSMES
jgi:hypothetical protein